ncbi:lysin [Weissella oryzae SG25]|uniref:Lysin n=1 Tax=Weissella oryzae (strain DSM 25784 / JCM 18191 / LMG 30913 / SG25) TaxID=1329250 RepID=A0A069CSL7_WEIOS|nr:glycoside hydrolase family 25 protein [Weissella oryzae]GAK30233.1 lysin [Weissella oryzae SG25]
MNKFKTLAVATATAFLFAGGMAVTNDSVHADSYGTDVSSHQGNYLADNWDFAIVKATEGTSYTNPYMYSQSLETQQKGKHLGYYHYLRSDSDVIAQAHYFVNSLSAADIANPDVTLWLDFEEGAVDGNHFTGNEPKQFMDEVQRLTGKKVGIYTSYFFAKGANGRFDWSDIADHPLWVAFYPYMGNTTLTAEIKEWAEKQMLSIPWWSKVTSYQYGDGGGYDWDYLYGNWSDLTGSTSDNDDSSVTPPDTSKAETASLNDVYVVDSWKTYNGDWYARNNDMSIPVADYNNDMPVQSLTLTDRYGNALSNQVAQGNNGRMEYFTLNDNYKVLSRAGNSIEIEMNGEPVWLKLAYVK